MPEPKGTLIVPVGFRASGLLRALALDDNDYLKVTFVDASVGLVGNNGYIGGAFQKDPLRIGYSGPVREAVSNDSHAAGAVLVSGAAVPSNTLWVVTAISGTDVDTIPTAISLGASLGGITHFFDSFIPSVVNMNRGVQGYFILREGDYIFAAIFGTVLNSRLRLYYSGFYVTLNL